MSKVTVDPPTPEEGAASNPAVTPRSWKFWSQPSRSTDDGNDYTTEEEEKDLAPKEKWSLGILNDKYTEEVPGKDYPLAITPIP